MISFIEKVRLGISFDDVRIIDCHCHIGCWKGYHTPQNAAEGILTSMDTLGIDKACVSAFVSVGPDAVFGNNTILDIVKVHAGRLFGYVTVNPHYCIEMQYELDGCLKAEGIIGIKLHPAFHGCAPDDERYGRAYETANSMGGPMLIHTWGRGDIAAVDRMAERHPEAKIIIGHAGGEIRAMEDSFKVVAAHKNVFIDTALSFSYEGNIEWLVQNCGSKKILFGTDMPNFDPRPTFGRIAMAGITEDEKKDILGLNMTRLLGI